MIAYLIKYQTRRRCGASTHQGDWQDKEAVVVAEEDAREAVDNIVNDLRDHDFRLRGVEEVAQVTKIARRLTVRTNPTDQGSQGTTE